MKYYKPENGNTNLQNLCHTAKAKKGKFIAIQSFLKKQEKQTNLKQQPDLPCREIRQRTKFKKRKEIIKSKRK